MIIDYSVRSHKGNVRENNEDNFYCAGVSLTPETRKSMFQKSGSMASPCLFAVCDGMGGQEDGEVASQHAANWLGYYSDRINDASGAEKDAIVQQYVAETNTQLLAEMRNRGVRMGTTFAMAAVDDDGIHAYWLGDSRIYAVFDGKFFRISEDHTPVTSKIKLGIMSEQEARRSGDWHKLTAFLGMPVSDGEAAADCSKPISVKSHARVLICSDGLTDMVFDDSIEKHMRQSKTADEAASRLLQEALINGGRDNTTLIVFDIMLQQIGQTQIFIPKKTKRGKVKNEAGSSKVRIVCVIAAIAILAAAAVFLYRYLNARGQNESGTPSDDSMNISENKVTMLYVKNTRMRGEGYVL